MTIGDEYGCVWLRHKRMLPFIFVQALAFDLDSDILGYFLLTIYCESIKWTIGLNRALSWKLPYLVS